MGLCKYRADEQGTKRPNGSIPWYCKWMGGPTLALVRNCPTPWGPRTVYVTGEADTMFSIPAAMTWRLGGKTINIRGYLCQQSDCSGLNLKHNEDPGLEFRPNKSEPKKNPAALPKTEEEGDLPAPFPDNFASEDWLQSQGYMPAWSSSGFEKEGGVFDRWVKTSGEYARRFHVAEGVQVKLYWPYSCCRLMLQKMRPGQEFPCPICHAGLKQPEPLDKLLEKASWREINEEMKI